MGLNSITKQPCGFCFVEYYTRQHTLDCLNYISGTVCDNQIIRCDLDAGYKPGRQYGRGQSGGQVRDERRISQEMNQQRRMSGNKRGRHSDAYEAGSGSGEPNSTNLIVDLNKALSSRREGLPPTPFPLQLAVSNTTEIVSITTSTSETVEDSNNISQEADISHDRDRDDDDGNDNSAKRSRR